MGGHHVRFLVRNPDRLHTSAEQIGVDIADHVVGDIADPDSTAAALQGCDAVIHCAAMVSTDPARSEEMLRTNLDGARNVLGGAVAATLNPIIHVSSFSALFRPGLPMLHADLPVVGGSDGYGKSKAVVEAYARGLQDAGAPGRSAAWIVVDVRDLAALHVALLQPGHGPRRYMAIGRRVAVNSLASLIGATADRNLVVYPVPDVGLRALGRLFDVVGDYLPNATSASSNATRRGADAGRHRRRAAAGRPHLDHAWKLPAHFRQRRGAQR